METNYYSAQLDNAAEFEAYGLVELQEKITEYYMDMERDTCPEAVLITHFHGDDETRLGVAKTAAFNAVMLDLFHEKVMNAHYDAEHNRGTAQITGRL